MSVPELRNQVEIGIGRILSQFQEKPYLVGLFRSFLENIQIVEETWFELLNERGIYVAVGQQLDVLGLLAGESRNGRTDEPYRQAILRKIVVNASDGTAPKVLEILELLTQSTEVSLFEHYPATVYYYVSSGEVSENLPATMEAATGAGIKTGVIFDDGNSFIPAALTYAEDTLGLDDSAGTPPNTLGIDTGDELGAQSYFIIPFGERSYLPHDDSTNTNYLAAIF